MRNVIIFESLELILRKNSGENFISS